MRFVADFHIHSKYSRAVSKDMVLEELDRWADDKGILVMGTGDFTHPEWFRDLKEKLEPAEPGLFRLKPEFKLKTIKGTLAETRFMLTVEISGIYTRGDRGRRIHNLVFVPDFETAEKINVELSQIGNVKSDGRPILGIDSEDLARIVLSANPNAAVIPAHAWTPWFSIFGSKSGFDTLEECFGKFAPEIFAIETGLSSDPAMNWRCSMLDRIALISNSDSHSLERIGREANIFDTELSYRGVMDALRSRDPKHFVSTIEFFPEEGRYHYDGHRACNVSWNPNQTRQHRGICSGCGKPVTVGVMSRVAALADRPAPKLQKVPVGALDGCSWDGRTPFVSLVPLDEIIGEAFGVGPQAKSVRTELDRLIREFGSELAVLMERPMGEVGRVAKPEVVAALERVRSGKLMIEPGYDGEYGTVKIFNGEADRNAVEPQTRLF